VVNKHRIQIGRGKRKEHHRGHTLPPFHLRDKNENEKRKESENTRKKKTEAEGWIGKEKHVRAEDKIDTLETFCTTGIQKSPGPSGRKKGEKS